jgi:hypothetical protein
VSRWADHIKTVTAEVRKGNKEKLVTLTFQCRNVAATQDDLVRALCVATMGVMEAAADAGAPSAKDARLAEQVIARCRRVLRNGTVLEPRRVRFLGDSPEYSE